MWVAPEKPAGSYTHPHLTMRSKSSASSSLRPFAAAALLSLLIAGCASIINGGSQNIAIQSSPSSASVRIVKAKNASQVYAGTTPCTVNLERSTGYFSGANYTVEISKAGYGTQTVSLTSHVSGWYIGNLGFGGVIGLLIVDPLTGGMYSLSPENVNAELRSRHAGLLSRDGRLIVMLHREVPKDLLPYLKPVKQG